MAFPVFSFLGKKTKDPTEFGAAATFPATKLVKLSASSDPLVGGASRGLWAATDGTVNLVDAEGNAQTSFPLFKGYNPVSALKVTNLGTITDLWAMY